MQKKHFTSLEKKEKKFLIEVVANYKTDQFKKSLENFKKNEKHFQRFGNFDYKIFLLDVIKPKYAKVSYERLKNWNYRGNTYSFEIPNFKVGANETLLDKKYRQAFQSINKFLKNSDFVHRYMKDFEDEVMLMTLQNKPKFYSLDKTKQAIEKQKSMIKVLEKFEKDNKFISAKTLGYKALNLKNKSYSMDAWLKMLSDGKIFNDTTFKKVDSVADLNDGNRNGHGYFTHRIQWHVLMRHMEKEPSQFYGFNARQLFQKLGSKVFNQKLGLANSGSDTLWQMLFDSFSGSYHQPETFRRLHSDYPDLGAWL